MESGLETKNTRELFRRSASIYKPTIISLKQLLNGGVGVVAVASGELGDHWKAYIGVMNGIDPNADAWIITRTGTRLLRAEAIAFFPELEPMLCRGGHLPQKNTRRVFDEVFAIPASMKKNTQKSKETR